MNILVNNQPIEYTHNPVILGIIFDKKLNFTDHFLNLARNITSKINILKLLSHKSNRLNIKTLMTIFKAFILSKIQYSMIPFQHTTMKNRNELQILQNKCLKIILGLPTRTSTSFIHSTLKLDMLETRINKLCSNYLTKAKLSNESIKETITRSKSL